MPASARGARDERRGTAICLMKTCYPMMIWCLTAACDCKVIRRLAVRRCLPVPSAVVLDDVVA